MDESTDTKNRIYAAQERARLELLKDIQATADFPGGVIPENTSVFSSTFQAALPELLVYSQRKRTEELTERVGRLGTISAEVLRATDRVYQITKVLLVVALLTLGVAVVSLVDVLVR